MSTRFAIFATLLIVTSALSACGGSSGASLPPPPPPPAQTRAFELGFTPWPYDATVNAVNFVYTEIAQRGDFIAHHLDEGVPWQEALTGAAYPAEVEGEIAARLNATPAGMRTYLAISPLGQVPTLVDDDVIITDSCAALVYLAKKYGDERWLPEDPAGSQAASSMETLAKRDLPKWPAITPVAKIRSSSRPDPGSQAPSSHWLASTKRQARSTTGRCSARRSS